MNRQSDIYTFKVFFFPAKLETFLSCFNRVTYKSANLVSQYSKFVYNLNIFHSAKRNKKKKKRKKGDGGLMHDVLTCLLPCSGKFEAGL